MTFAKGGLDIPKASYQGHSSLPGRAIPTWVALCVYGLEWGKNNTIEGGPYGSRMYGLEGGYRERGPLLLRDFPSSFHAPHPSVSPPDPCLCSSRDLPWLWNGWLWLPVVAVAPNLP